MGFCKFSKFDLLSLIIVLYVVHCENDAQILNERVSLLSFMSRITDDPKGALESWKNSSSDILHVCKWSGVTCDMKENRVIEVNLTHKSLRGTISPALSNLSYLEILDLSGNFFEGQIPGELGFLYRLKELSLSSNHLEGEIPFEMRFLQELVYLNLGSNKLVGEIPMSLLCNGSNSLQYLDLSNNSLSGEIPLESQCELRELRYLLLWSNRLVGEVPLALSNSTKLEWIDLESNLLTGELPSEILSKMPHLKFLYLSYNRFSSHNGNTNLKPFFASLVNSSNLQEIDLAGNYLGGELPSIIGDLSTLVQINLDTNLIYGPIPPQISNIVNLTLLNLSSNLLNGSIPSELCQMGRLERLYLSNNSLSGHIPYAFGNMPHLGLLDLSKNKLSGTIPESFANLVQLRRLLLYENELSGPIPPSLGKCINLEILDLSHNMISGIVPSELVAGLSNLKLYLNLSTNLLHGHIPLELSKMDMVLAIDLSKNNLSSGVPSQLGSCIALEYLNLSHNAFEGQFPTSIGNLPYLKQLDLSFNHFNGELPQSLQESSTLKVMNFSYNDFHGNITNKGAFSSLTVTSFFGNDKLCGSSIKGLPNCHKPKRARHFLVAILLSLLITPIFCLVGYPLVLKSKSKKQLPAVNAVKYELEASEEIKYPRISRKQLIEATGGFSSSSLIGSGRFGHVYKGVLRDNTRIAVKVIDSKEVSGSFKRECQVLKRARHRNLIRIITTCSRPDFKALVLPLMPNGSLENHLYPSHGLKNGLDLVQLVSICSDVAEGLAYLHHYSPVRVVHCDLKPSNILLDNDLTALVTDFGIAKLVKGGDESVNGDDSASFDSTDGLLCGSIGYIAPEYGMGRHASTQGDVYSFGVLLLEIVTGKRPTDVLFQEGSNMHEWVKCRYPNKLEPIVEEAIARCAPRATVPCNRKIWSDVILELIELGLICTQYNPSIRPSMLDVAHEVSLLKQYLCGANSTALLIEQTQPNHC
ncbi:hypothetical protein BUALT_Bualt12G0076500 [Buddleja alternifolia]|uniref:non-specific serine/threonine protein kinase n=1 Tax=Buddleja alternifolia TaxID=168488 RepID=A0AAV6WPW5_9LAMI|nr:hypothetical protein BUALT_Bualt12G0076500 [Buddleja alternifolia]